MKIQCDVCSKEEASVFCSADEAALCNGCDQRVHHANELASKHQRFSLSLPSSSHYPLCDICQEKRALLFCQQDRAILCKGCDIPLHSANEYTKQHNRFLLTGVKLSAMISYHNSKKVDDITSNGVTSSDPVPDFKATQKPTSDSSEKASLITNSTDNSSNNQMIYGGLTSNISEYLIEMLPGWHFEDLLVDAASPSTFGLCKRGNKQHDFEKKEDVLSYVDVENDKEKTCSSIECDKFWVPQAEAIAASSNFRGQPSESQHTTGGLVLVHGTKQKLQQQETSVSTIKFNTKCLKDDTFTVPQITSSQGSKIKRSYW